jgi:hypothetical protein
MVDKPTFPGTLAPLFQGKRMVQTLQTQGQSYMVAPQATIFFPFFFLKKKYLYNHLKIKF